MKRRKGEKESPGMCVERKNGRVYRATARGNRNVRERIEMKGERRARDVERRRESRWVEARNNRRCE